MGIIKARRKGYESRKAIAGYFFLLPWLIGFAAFFIRFLIESVVYSFSNVRITENGALMQAAGLGNYRYALLSDPAFIRIMADSTVEMLYRVPIIMMFSLFTANILNQKFKGRTLVRTIFFLPVIITTGVVINMIKGDHNAQQMLAGEGSSLMLQAETLTRILLESGFGNQIVSFMAQLVNSVFEVAWRSGIQILLFLAGLQSIPKALYEAGDMEGATMWEKFWKITFPMLSPILMVNIIYTLIDSFSDYSNPVIKLIFNYSKELNISYSATLSIIYFAFIFIVLCIIYAIINKRIFYVVE